MVRKVIQDLAGSRASQVRESEVRSKMDESLAVAREQVKTGELSPSGHRSRGHQAQRVLQLRA